MDVLVIGGTGIIGTGIVESAARKGYNVYAISRQKDPIHDMDIPVNYIRADWNDEGQARDAIGTRTFDVIVDGLVFNPKQLKRDLSIVNGHCSHYIYISTAGVYNQPAINISEDAPKEISKLIWDYSVYKRKAEVFLESHYAEYNFMISIVRPPFTYGDTRIPCAMVGRQNQWTILERIKTGKPIVFIEDGESKHAVTHISTFSDAVVAIFMNDAANHQIFHVADDNSYTWDEVIRVVGKIVGKEPTILHVPIETLKPYNRELYDEIKYNKLKTLTLNNTKMRTLAPNVNYCVPLEIGLNRTVKYLYEVYEKRPLDMEFDFMSDAIILNNLDSITAPEEQLIASTYLAEMDELQKEAIHIWARNAKKSVFRKATKKTIKRYIKKIIGR